MKWSTLHLWTQKHDCHPELAGLGTEDPTRRERVGSTVSRVGCQGYVVAHNSNYHTTNSSHGILCAKLWFCQMTSFLLNICILFLCRRHWILLSSPIKELDPDKKSQTRSERVTSSYYMFTDFISLLSWHLKNQYLVQYKLFIFLYIWTKKKISAENVGQCLFLLFWSAVYLQDENPAVITWSHGHKIKASALSLSAPEADKLMGSKGH